VNQPQKSYEEFVSECWNDMMKFAFSCTGHSFDADDVLSEALTRLWFVWDERQSCSPSDNRGWLVNTIKNVAKEQNRRKKKTASLPDSLLHLPHHSPEIQAFEESQQYEYYIRELLAELDEDEADLFRLFFIEGKSYDQVARARNVKNSTLRSIIHRLRKRLREKAREMTKKI